MESSIPDVYPAIEGVGTLLIQRARPGDLIQSLPLLERAMESSDRVGLLCSPDIAAWARELSVCRMIMTLPGVHPEEGFSGAYPKWKALVGELRGGHWERAVHLNNDGGGVALLKASGIRERYGFERSIDRRTFGGRVPGWPEYLVSSARGLRQKNRLHLSDVWREFLPQGPRQTADHAPVRGGSDSSPVVMVLSGRSVYRSLAEETLLRIIGGVTRQTGRRVILSGRPDEWESGERIRRLSGDHVRNMAGKTSIGELDGLIREAALVISPDTATLHLAAWRGIPTIGLFFGGASPHETGARFGARVSIVSRMDCYPCGGEGSGCRTILCREQFDGDLVGRVAASLLAGMPLPPSRPDLLILRGREGDGDFNTQEISGELVLKSGDPERESAFSGALFRRFFLRLLPGKRALDPLSRAVGAFGTLSDEKTVSALLKIRRGVDLYRAMLSSPVGRRVALVNEFPGIWPIANHLLLCGDVRDDAGGGGDLFERRSSALSFLSEEIDEVLSGAVPERGPFRSIREEVLVHAG
jgi:ADP-heptose:LPS heptosyltransferase